MLLPPPNRDHGLAPHACMWRVLARLHSPPAHPFIPSARRAQWPLRHLRELLEELVQIAHASRGRDVAADLDLRPLPLD